MREWFLRFSGSMRTAATLCWALLALKFAFASLGHAATNSQRARSVPASVKSETPRPDPLAVVTALTPPAPSASGRAKPRILHVSVVVGAGEARSEVFMNGLKLGHAPFVGQASCEEGSKVRIDLLPPKGVPKSYAHRCVGTTIRVVDEP